MYIGIKIRRLRELNNFSQPELAHRLGISQTTLCNIESGDTKKIDFFLVDKVCQEFNINFEYFAKNKHSKNIIKKQEGNANHNEDIVNKCTEGILEQIKILIEDNKQKVAQIKELEIKLKGL